MTYRYLLLVLPFFIVSCSSSDDSDDELLNDQNVVEQNAEQDVQQNLADVGEQSGNTDAVEISELSFAGNSELAQLGVPVALELSRELVTSSYLEQYFSVDSAIGQLMVESIGGQDAFENDEIPEGELRGPVACPEGGTVNVSYTDRNGPFGVFTGVFTDCMLEGQTLSGSLTRNASSNAIGGGASSSVDVDFDALSISDDVNGTLTLSGSASRATTTTSAEMLLPGERGSCELVEANYTLAESSAMQSARLERPNVAGSVTINESSYERSDRRNYDATSDQANCPLDRESRESGNAAVTFEAYSAASLNGSGSLTTTVATDVVADDRTHSATQATALPDGSLIAVTATSNIDCAVQVDVNVAGVALSLVDDFCFATEDF